MDWRQKLLTFMREAAYKPITAEELISHFMPKAEDLKRFWQVLNELEAAGEIIKTRAGRYGVPERMDLAVGRLQGHSKGFGFVIPKDPEIGDVYIPADAINGAMHNDRVVARLHKRAVDGRTREGEIIRILERANTTLVGTFEKSRHFGFVVPDDPRITQDVFISREDFNGAREGDKVVVAITRWPEKRRNPEGKVIEIIGYKDDPGVDIISIIKKHRLPFEFQEAVNKQAQRIPLDISPEEAAGRMDLRRTMMVTIDSEDAKDLDDAVSIERLPDGGYRLGVHIADVGHYVREGSVLDKEARERGTSVYLVDRVIPMLPPRLSNGICSLNAGEDRLAMTVFMDFDARGRRLRYSLHESIINVTTRLTYTIVGKILVDKDRALREQYRELVPHLEVMEELCLLLREQRMRRGSIDFDFSEVKVKLDVRGRPVDILKIERSIADSVIEEFMLAANETVAQHAHGLDLPFLYRVHEEPDSEKMADLNELLHNFGYRLKNPAKVHPKMLQAILHKIAGKPEEKIISTIMLRSLKQARYEAENLGHFGLAAEYYTHFTSPIRRYPDLVIHRILKETLRRDHLSAKRQQHLKALLPEIAAHSSERERAAAEAERESLDLKKVEYMADKIGNVYPGIVSGVTAFGMFVELENGIEGLVHVSNMVDDYYHFHEKAYALVGERTRKTYRIGSQVRVKVLRIDRAERTLDFALAEGGGKGGRLS